MMRNSPPINMNTGFLSALEGNEEIRSALIAGAMYAHSTGDTEGVELYASVPVEHLVISTFIASAEITLNVTNNDFDHAAEMFEDTEASINGPNPSGFHTVQMLQAFAQCMRSHLQESLTYQIRPGENALSTCIAVFKQVCLRAGVNYVGASTAIREQAAAALWSGE